MPRLDVNAVRRIGCAALLLGLFSQLAIFLVPSNANEREPTSKCDVESEIEEFCRKNEITEHAVHVALAHLWCSAAASRGADALEPSERPRPDDAQQLRVGYADLYWVGWCARLEAVDLELSASGSIRSVLVLELKDPGAPGFSRESSTDAYLAGDKSAWSLVLKALEEAQDARGEPENVGMAPRAFSRELPHYQAILLLKHMIRNDSRLGRWRKPQGMLESNSEQARELKRPPVKRELVLTKNAEVTDIEITDVLLQKLHRYEALSKKEKEQLDAEVAKVLLASPQVRKRIEAVEKAIKEFEGSIKSSGDEDE